jgi:hypothetical protein
MKKRFDHATARATGRDGSARAAAFSMTQALRDPMAREVFGTWTRDPKAIERQFGSI